MKWAIIAAVAMLSGGCSTLPPVLQRWADLEIATTNLIREDSKAGEAFYFSQDGRVRVFPNNDDAPAVSWRVRGEWLEIETKNDGTFQTRMRALSIAKDGLIVAESPTRKKSLWRKDRVIVVIQMEPARPGLWMP